MIEQLKELNIAEGRRLLAIAMNRKAARIWKQALEWECSNPGPSTRVSAENPYRSEFSDHVQHAKRLGIKIDIRA